MVGEGAGPDEKLMGMTRRAHALVARLNRDVEYTLNIFMTFWSSDEAHIKA
jgi:hypothetical protein